MSKKEKLIARLRPRPTNRSPGAGGSTLNDMISYKGYLGSVHYSDEDQSFFGKLEYIKSLVNYEGTDVKTLKKSFEEAVDDYLELCAHNGIEPEKPFKGSFNVRAGSELHRKAALYAKENGLNLNTVVSEALEQYLSKKVT